MRPAKSARRPATGRTRARPEEPGPTRPPILHFVGAASGALAAPEISRLLAATGHSVEVGLDPRARNHFVGPAAFGRFATVVQESSGPYLAVLAAPAPAEVLARLAQGLGGLFGAEVTSRPFFVAPDLDAGIARHPAVRENLGLLRADGVRVIEGPEGAMAEPAEIATRVLSGLGGPLSGRRVLVTAGGTREPLDSVRFLGNRSSGKMGLAVAREAARLGAEVTVVAANVERVEPGVEWVPVETVEEMQEAVLFRAEEADMLVMAAAVSDFTPAAPAKEKIRRREGSFSLELRGTPDILAAVREGNPELFVVGFAATHGDPVADAREKLVKKGADLIVGNDISRAGIGFGAEENEVCIVAGGWERFVPRASKFEVARIILQSAMDEINKERRK